MSKKSKPQYPTNKLEPLPENIPIPARRRKGVHVSAAERRQLQDGFLKAFSNTANVRIACIQTGVTPASIRWWKDHDPVFAEAYEQANEDANWALFGEAWRRAMQGEKEYVVSVGKLIYGPDGEPLTIQKRSDRLLELLLKARLPEFREKGTTIVNVLPKEYVNLPVDGDIE